MALNSISLKHSSIMKKESQRQSWLRKVDDNPMNILLPMVTTLFLLTTLYLLREPRTARFWVVWAIAVIGTHCHILLKCYEYERYLDSLRPKGCSKVSASNLSDEYHPKHAFETAEKEWKVKSLLIYPIKSCRAVEANRAEVLSTGLKYDRQFSFAQLLPSTPSSRAALGTNRSFWSFLTQREQACLATVWVELWLPDPSVEGYSPDLPDVQSEGAIIVHYPTVGRWSGSVKPNAGEAFKIPFNPTPEWILANNCTWEPMKIWKDYPTALNLSSVIPKSFRNYVNMNHPLGLFRASASTHREVYRNAPRKEELGYQPVTDFADAYPLHILNVASVQDLSANLTYELPRMSVRRFRPNIVVTGPKAYAEDEWKQVRIGRYEYHVPCRTVRCKMPNVCDKTGKRHTHEPDFTLRKMRDVDAGAKGFGCLGMQAVPAEEHGVVKVGDRVRVLETGKHRYIML